MYIILEAQTNANGTVGTLVDTYTDRNTAENKYHTVLASAAVSQLPLHSVFMLSNEGYIIKSECYTHGAETESEPETGSPE